MQTIVANAPKSDSRRSVNEMKYLKSILWIAFFSLVGFVQFLLIIGGVLFFKEGHMSPPWIDSILSHGGAFFAFLT